MFFEFVIMVNRKKISVELKDGSCLEYSDNREIDPIRRLIGSYSEDTVSLSTEGNHLLVNQSKTDKDSILGLRTSRDGKRGTKIPLSYVKKVTIEENGHKKVFNYGGGITTFEEDW